MLRAEAKADTAEPSDDSRYDGQGGLVIALEPIPKIFKAGVWI